ncbi:hypothetical protein BT96DRAFT_567931 [Gymnopus androsaceus JB14]|uniref:Uncharacterized protein n=1 Tax=Gymnopus androsaceus JB14 TaxID=1447944 RepID=A0A6A4GJD1_9AGAR|nr:hypothetical protein BT96DRAFT_567931 [Gymnopus androsaceus JB14]
MRHTENFRTKDLRDRIDLEKTELGGNSRLCVDSYIGLAGDDDSCQNVDSWLEHSVISQELTEAYSNSQQIIAAIVLYRTMKCYDLLWATVASVAITQVLLML